MRTSRQNDSHPKFLRKILILISVLAIVTLIYGLGTAQADLGSETNGVSGSHRKSGGAANGGRSCLNPSSGLSAGSGTGNLNASRPRVKPLFGRRNQVSLNFEVEATTALRAEMNRMLDRVLLGGWTQTNCECAQVGGKSFKIVASTANSVTLENDLRVTRLPGEKLRIEYLSNYALKLDCEKLFGIPYTVREEHPVHVSVLLDPGTPVFPDPDGEGLLADRQLLKRTLDEERKLLCQPSH